MSLTSAIFHIFVMPNHVSDETEQSAFLVTHIQVWKNAGVSNLKFFSAIR
jgi:hypothetical protein